MNLLKCKKRTQRKRRPIKAKGKKMPKRTLKNSLNSNNSNSKNNKKMRIKRPRKLRVTRHLGKKVLLTLRTMHYRALKKDLTKLLDRRLSITRNSCIWNKNSSLNGTKLENSWKMLLKFDIFILIINSIYIYLYIIFFFYNKTILVIF